MSNAIPNYIVKCKIKILTLSLTAMSSILASFKDALLVAVPKYLKKIIRK